MSPGRASIIIYLASCSVASLHWQFTCCEEDYGRWQQIKPGLLCACFQSLFEQVQESSAVPSCSQLGVSSVGHHAARGSAGGWDITCSLARSPEAPLSVCLQVQHKAVQPAEPYIPACSLLCAELHACLQIQRKAFRQ